MLDRIITVICGLACGATVAAALVAAGMLVYAALQPDMTGGEWKLLMGDEDALDQEFAQTLEEECLAYRLNVSECTDARGVGYLDMHR